MHLKYLSAFGFLFLAILSTETSSAAPSTGNISVAFIMSQFQDENFQNGHNQDYFEGIAFNSSDSMWDYYDEVSEGMLNIEGDVFGPYTLDENAANYSSGSKFVKESVLAADNHIDYREYDAVIAIHSGPGAESSGQDDDIHSAFWSGLRINTNDGDYQVRQVSQVPEYQLANGEKNPLGVWCHEFGHELGLPDFYDTDYSSEGSGNWAVMAAGSWGNNGETPVYFSAYSRSWLGWETPELVTDDITNLVIEPVSEGGKSYKLPIPGNQPNSNEYFLIENRQQSNYDEYIPGEGLLIWHIDENILNSKWDSNTVNNDEDHKGMDLEEADGNDDLDDKTNRGDAGDPYTSGSFNKTTYPNSLAYNGSESGWKIDIEVDGDNIILDISFLSKPYAFADADKVAITEGESIQFNGNRSSDEDGIIVNYTWNFGDGKYNYTINPIHTFMQNGEYNVTLTVRDNHGLEHTYILKIYVNKPPIAAVVISNTTIMLGETITFDASNSYDLDGEIIEYLWNFDDGSPRSKEIVELHTYADSGIFQVSLQLMDDRSVITTTYYIIEVINSPPEVNFTFSPSLGNTLTLFEFTDLSTDSDGIIEEWHWDFGDGNTSSERNPVYSYSFPGTYVINLTLIDDQRGENYKIYVINIDNAPPDPNINIEEGLNIGSNLWKVPTDRTIRLDAGNSTDNDNTILTYLWTYNSVNTESQYLDLVFSDETYNIELTVTDPEGANTTETFEIIGTNVPIININYDNLNLVVNQKIEIISTPMEDDINLYKWSIYKVNSDLTNILEEINTNSSRIISLDEKGNYKLTLSGRTIDSNLWTDEVQVHITVYDKPVAFFDFDEEMNEDTWIDFNGVNSTGINLNYIWTLDGKILEGNSSIISTYIDSGGKHIMNLTVEQDPVGKSFYESEIYLNSKPNGVLTTNPALPRVGEDFEIYLNAFDVETDANIDYLKIIIIDNKGNERGNLEYIDQGANFNVIFEVEYAGKIVLEYSLTDFTGNKNQSSNLVKVIGWADIYVDELNIIGSNERGKIHVIETVLTNYNETYNTTNYNGYNASGYAEIFIDSEMVHTFKFNIMPESSESFTFEWTSTGNYHEFEVKTYVDEGEVITNNNNFFTSKIFDSERKSGLLNSLTSYISIITISFLALIRRKPN